MVEVKKAVVKVKDMWMDELLDREAHVLSSSICVAKRIQGRRRSRDLLPVRLTFGKAVSAERKNLDSLFEI